jgi:hypothetical protein
VEGLEIQIVSVLAVCRHFLAAWEQYNDRVQATAVGERFPDCPNATRAIRKTIAEWRRRHDAGRTKVDKCRWEDCLRSWFAHWRTHQAFKLPKATTTAPTW